MMLCMLTNENAVVRLFHASGLGTATLVVVEAIHILLHVLTQHLLRLVGPLLGEVLLLSNLCCNRTLSSERSKP
jgi:hypothetical protein